MRLAEAKRRLHEELEVERQANDAYNAYRARGAMKDGRRFGRPPNRHTRPAIASYGAAEPPRTEWPLITATHNLLKLWRHTTARCSPEGRPGCPPAGRAANSHRSPLASPRESRRDFATALTETSSAGAPPVAGWAGGPCGASPG